MLRVTFLGTSSARPTVSRNTSALAVQRGSDLFLFDCGEGTQRQMMRYSVGFSVKVIFITHMHADHYLGVIGLLRTMSLQGRDASLDIFCPPGGDRLLAEAIGLELEELSFPFRVSPLGPGEASRFAGYQIVAFAARHAGRANGYVLREDARPGRFHPDRARALGVPEGPLFGRLQRGEVVTVGEGRRVAPGDVMGPPRPGRVLVYSGDTEPSEDTVRAASGCDVLVHEATFAEDDADRAARTGHSTARQAGEIARRAGASRLVLTHFSARYSERPWILEKEAREACAGACEVVAAHDGLTLEIALSD